MRVRELITSTKTIIWTTNEEWWGMQENPWQLMRFRKRELGACPRIGSYSIDLHRLCVLFGKSDILCDIFSGTSSLEQIQTLMSSQLSIHQQLINRIHSEIRYNRVDQKYIRQFCFRIFMHIPPPHLSKYVRTHNETNVCVFFNDIWRVAVQN